MTTWEEIRDEVAGTLADGQPLEDVISKLDEMKNSKPMTNEEWLRQASTEELADVLTEIACESYYDGLDEKLPLKHNCKHFMKWLKEKHHAE